MEKKDNLTPIRFHFYSLKFTPYKADNSKHTSISILKDVITYLSQEILKGKGHLIDRHQDRKNEEPRELFMTSAIFMPKERRIRCSLAVLRSGKQPLLKPAEKFKLVPLDKSQGSIAEQTHFFIDYNKSHGIVCAEFNYHGPRVSDLEYYLRNVAHDTLKLSKVTEVELFMDTSIDKTLAELKNVLNIDIKIQPKRLTSLDTELVGRYFTGINSFGNHLKPKFLKIEAMFQTPGSTVKSSQLNAPANDMITNFLKKFKSKPLNIDCFENFVVKYEDKNGSEEVFNLLRGKKEVIKEVDLNKLQKARDWYELIETDFNDFIQSL